MASALSHRPLIRRSTPIPRPVYVGSVVDTMAQRQTFLLIFRFSLSVSKHEFSILIHSSVAYVMLS